MCFENDVRPRNVVLLVTVRVCVKSGERDVFVEFMEGQPFVSASLTTEYGAVALLRVPCSVFRLVSCTGSSGSDYRSVFVG